MEKGIVFFIKDGEVVKKIDFKQQDFYDVMKFYEREIKEGYSVVQITFFSENEEQIENLRCNRADVIVNLEISDKDASLLQEWVENLEEAGYGTGTSRFYLYNEHINMFQKRDYDEYSPSFANGAPCSSVLPYFLKEKLGTLREEEKRVVSCYRDFDLDRMLLDNEAQSYVLTNGNAGVIVVDKSKTYQSTNKKYGHGEEFKTVFSGISVDPSALETEFVWRIADVSEDILIHVYFKELQIWAPKIEKLNDYQKDYLKNLAHHLYDLNEQIVKKEERSALQLFVYAGTEVIEDYSKDQQTVSEFLEFVDSGFDVDFKDKKEKSGMSI